jgi:hypothetical protein
MHSNSIKNKTIFSCKQKIIGFQKEEENKEQIFELQIEVADPITNQKNNPCTKQ